MKLLLFTVFIIAVFTAYGRDLSHEIDEAYPFPNGVAPERQDQQMEERKIAVAGVTQYPDYTDEDYQNIPDGREFQESAEEDRKLKDQLDGMEMLLGRSRWCRKRGGRCSRRKFSCAGGYIESPLGRPYCTSKNRRCCYPVECSAPWKKIPGSGLCYLFSKDVDEGTRNQAAAKQYCQKQGGDLAVAGYLPDTEADPLVTYIKENDGYGTSWVGAQKSGSIWKWSDGRIFTADSKLWDSVYGNPSGDGDCVEILQDYETAGLNDLSCTHLRDFVCQKK